MKSYTQKYTKKKHKLSADELSGMSDMIINLEKLRLMVTDSPRVAQGEAGGDAGTTKPIAIQGVL